MQRLCVTTHIHHYIHDHRHNHLDEPLDLAELAVLAARRCGDPNAQSFTWAFHQTFGQRPLVWRAPRTDRPPCRSPETASPETWPVGPAPADDRDGGLDPMEAFRFAAGRFTG